MHGMSRPMISSNIVIVSDQLVCLEFVNWFDSFIPYFINSKALVKNLAFTSLHFLIPSSHKL